MNFDATMHGCFDSSPIHTSQLNAAASASELNEVSWTELS